MWAVDLLAVSLLAAGSGPRFVDATDAVGLGPDVVPETVARLCFADLDADGRPDAVIDRHRIFLNRADPAAAHGLRFEEVPPAHTGLATPDRSAAAVFADLDGDGHLDAITIEHVDTHNEKWTDHGRRTGWQRGRGDGTFGPRAALPTPPRTTIAVAVGDVDRDGGLDLFLGNTYRLYGGGYEGYANDLLLSERAGGWRREPLPDDGPDFDEAADAGGRPTFGAMIVDTPPAGVTLLELSYGRRWNRAWQRGPDGVWHDAASRLGLDGDAIRHGRHPEWLRERAKTDPRFDRDDELPFRANGNTFDAAVGDVDGDGRFDLLVSEITHGWAGESSDRTRILLRAGAGFVPAPHLDLDRARPDPQRWNQGDLFCGLADLDHDGRLDVVVSSGDYPDDQRLRVWLRDEAGGLRDRTADVGLDHDGSQQISFADVDGDGDLDLLAGQTFNRFTKEQREGRAPRLRLFLNELTEGRASIVLRLRGDGAGVNRDALGARVSATLPDGTPLVRQVVGIGGHAGKQHDFAVHLGLGGHDHVRDLVVTWPDRAGTSQRFEGVGAGRYRLAAGGALERDAPARAAAERPFTEQGYLGLSVRDIDGGHAVVSWILPGPLDGEGLSAPGVDLARPDLLVAVDGAPRTADGLREYVHGLAPGTRVAIDFRRANRRGSRIPDALDHEELVRRIEVTLASRDEWAGTLRRGRGHDATVTFGPERQLDPDDPASVLGAAVREHDLARPLDVLRGVFTEWQTRDDDFHSLARVRAGFDDPFRLPELAALVTAPAPEAAADPVPTAARMIRENLDTGSARPYGAMAWTGIARTPLEERLLRALHQSDLALDLALGYLHGDADFARRGLALLRVPHETFYIEGAATAAHVAVIRRSMTVRYEFLAPALLALAGPTGIAAEDLDGLAPTPVPAALRDAVEGEILSASHDPALGWVVVGGDGPNRYDLAKVAAVVDRGGDDVYAASGLRLGARLVVDLAGNDTYTGTPEQGPASALLGASVVDDRAGDDQYEGGLLAAGAAMFGASLLLDRGGNDTYVGTEWSIAAGCYGAGLLFDLGRGGDAYLGAFLCQGVGGPRGLGFLLDEGGRDLYRANGPSDSIYGTPAVYRAFSQGIGFGFRHYAAGGIGALCDLAGDDRYEAGEFAQGGAYYYGLGVLHDRRGRDLYYGNRYGQGFGVHQALGVLVDDAGDDTYWSMTAASQGAAWDVGAGLLLDRAGDDTYQCDGLGQGAASMQALALLVDLAGRDRYVARGAATQGESGADTYHFGETGAHSFSVLMDLGGTPDWYSRERSDDRTIATGAANPEHPARASLHGLFIDR